MLYYANKKEIVNNNNNDTSPSLIFPRMLQELQQLGLWGGGALPHHAYSSDPRNLQSLGVSEDHHPMYIK